CDVARFVDARAEGPDDDRFAFVVQDRFAQRRYFVADAVRRVEDRAVDGLLFAFLEVGDRARPPGDPRGVEPVEEQGVFWFAERRSRGFRPAVVGLERRRAAVGPDRPRPREIFFLRAFFFFEHQLADQDVIGGVDRQRETDACVGHRDGDRGWGRGERDRACPRHSRQGGYADLASGASRPARVSAELY